MSGSLVMVFSQVLPWRHLTKVRLLSNVVVHRYTDNR
jgi:hypothetical protein